MPKLLLRIEGLAILILSLYFYSYLHFSWLIFIILLFTPDLSALGYLKNVKFGSIMYNLFHTYTIPTGILLYGLIFDNEIILMLSFIWLAHIGINLLFCYCFKYSNTYPKNHHKINYNYFLYFKEKNSILFFI